jgi:hypothetical protein
MTMLGFLLGAAIGYVVGCRAGHPRYDRILRTCRQLIDHPAVQGAAGVVSGKINKTRGRNPSTAGS